MPLTSEAEGDVISVRIICLNDMNNGVWCCIFTDKNVFDSLHKHRVLVIHVCDVHADHSRATVRHWVAVVSSRDGEVVRVINDTVIVQTPAHNTLHYQYDAVTIRIS